MNALETIKITKDGSKQMKFNGIEFWINPYNVIMLTSDWGVVDQLVSARLATRKTYKNLNSHTEYKVK